MSDSSLCNLLAAHDLLQQQWYEALQADPISYDDLFRLHIDLQLLEAAIRSEEQ
jgi:hypothetical protein